MKKICIILFILISILTLIVPTWARHKKEGKGLTSPQYGIKDEMKV